MNYSIFISYRREDSSAAVSSLLQRLQEKFGKNSIFADSESINEGDIWPDKIKIALEQSKIVLVVIGQNWLSSEKNNPYQIRLCSEGDWVRNEIETAQKLKKIIIPILVDVSEMPDHQDLPESVKILKNILFSRIKFQPGDGWKLFDITPLIQKKTSANQNGVMLQFKEENQSGAKQDWSGYQFVSREGEGEWKSRRPQVLVVESTASKADSKDAK